MRKEVDMELLEYIQSFDKFGTKGGFKPGLERIGRLLDLLGNPEQGLKYIHVGGTNGKGSTIAFLQSIYTSAGYQVGVYTSPPLRKFNERIRISNQSITDRELADLVDIIRQPVATLTNSEAGCPSFFEVVTALAFLYFAQKQPDLVLLEVGLGGRWDATNIIQQPLVSVITGIGLEHTDILGQTLPEIAREKAGIIKPGCPVITGAHQPHVLRELQIKASQTGSDLACIHDLYDYQIMETTICGQRCSLKRRDQPERKQYWLGLPGKFQLINALLALEVVTLLQGIFPLTESRIRQGLKGVSWPGRWELLSDNPPVLVDGAHNLQAIEGVGDLLEEITAPCQRVYFVMAVLADKDIQGMLASLKQRKFKKKFLFSQNWNNRSLSPLEIQQAARELEIAHKTYSGLDQAIKQALGQARERDIVFITGSLSTVGEAKSVLENSIKP
ncbi:MAG: bifunctional folylpolyglutamate synthase/dihydrofolate synthase [Bacillota bacterium]